ncbi:formate dehydrogenase subunit alpha [Pseudoteredinibacter isoporae]|uniref:Formate dehydrogenase major subunit n=1 Tax=Pseudoteredinibacter isoporae TaxID=570281 RepID=A0A7X0JRI6_9GAMM|nr:formate dehydrogenase major subunit [Pseudoteredinibacter isoporae]NHO85618.1 formate dehydrogenase subunit alpha [Pseudoteredinibacter isoporae]NIB25930.1 formate dehydrogenase subunit alpha [Pseudoteredinibacter isoporae]
MINFFDPNTDLGTPSAATGKTVNVIIDGKPLKVEEGSSIMRAALESAIYIPKLCATDSLEAYGSCRICAVEIEGGRGTPAACTTPVTEGMVVHTQSEKLQKLRRNIMELYISDHPLDCLSCSANGECELQDTAAAVGLREVRYGFNGENHLSLEKDQSNPYFDFEPSKCIVCSRCVRACEETQGTFALTVSGRGFDSQISAAAENILASDCVSCGACVQACPTASLMEKPYAEGRNATRSVKTTCAYCGVGCGFEVDLQGQEPLRMRPDKSSQSNHGHACVKGRFAFAYVNHPDRVRSPLIRDSIEDAWREASWEEAIHFAADKLKAVQAQYGRQSIGAITSSRCTNEETYLVQKLVRAAFGNNNTDTCARVCHSPTGYGLKTTLGESAGTQTFDSVLKSDLILVIGANPTDAHPVFGSLLRKRLRQGAELIVADPRHIDLLNTVHSQMPLHLPLLPGSNVALINAMAYTVISEELEDAGFIAERCQDESYQRWRTFIADDRHSPENMASHIGVDAERIRQAARRYAKAENAAIYYGLGVTEHSQGSSMVMGIANLALATGNIGREGVGINPLRGQNNVQGSCDMGSFPHEYPGYQHVSDESVQKKFEAAWGRELDPDPGFRIPNMFDAAIAGQFKGLYCQGEDIAQSDPNTQHVEAALRSLDCLIVQDIFLNETSRFAHVVLPGSSFLEKDGTFTNAERRINRVRKAIEPIAGKADWQTTMALSDALGYPMDYAHPSDIMDEIALLTPSFAGVNYDLLEEKGSIQWPCNEQNPEGTAIMHSESFPIGQARFAITEFVPTEEKVNRRFPLLLTTGRVLTQYNVGAQTRRTPNQTWHAEDVLEIHPFDAEQRGINDGDRLLIKSRVGETSLLARVSERMQAGVVYTTFHHPLSGANVVTTENSDWATNCPEYKVTAVQVEKCMSETHWQSALRKAQGATINTNQPFESLSNGRD